jgi:K+-transporting ATPase ATPase A chain
MVMVALLGLFLSGLLIGRTPEYIGKKLGPTETRVITLYALVSSFAILIPTAIAVVTASGKAGLTINDGPHGFTEILYAYASSMANNGQNFAGLSANSTFYNVTTGATMLAGRFALGVAALWLAGLVAGQPRRTASAGAFPTDSPLFGSVVIGTIAIVAGLSYFPALALGPVIEHFTP